jgi:hypothetical protein
MHFDQKISFAKLAVAFELSPLEALPFVQVKKWIRKRRSF